LEGAKGERRAGEERRQINQINLIHAIEDGKLQEGRGRREILRSGVKGNKKIRGTPLVVKLKAWRRGSSKVILEKNQD